jgi:hypothetical protein
MVSTLDILYIVLALCSVVITCVLVMLGVELLRVMRDMKQIAHNVEQITVLLERVSQAVFPGIERMARGAGHLDSTIATFFRKKVEKIIKNI